MRLTLRTMLAYLDDILEPADAQELSHKIEESQFAADLVHRIRNSTRRLRLGAPKLEGKGIGLDANTVSEYLDNTLPAENVPEFEKVCLESDVHLAEVASSHQILTLVLGEPVDIGDSLRERIYRIGNVEHAEQASVSESVAEAAPVESGDGAAPSPVPQPAPQPADKPAAGQDDLPSDSQVSAKSLFVTLLLAFLVAVVALKAMGDFDPTHPLWQLVAGGEQSDEEASELAGAPAQRPQGGDSETLAVVGQEDAQPSETAEVVDEQGPAADKSTDAEADSPEEPSEPDEPLSAPGKEVESPELVGDPSMEDVRASPEPTAAPAALGRYASEDQVLAQFNPKSEAWFALPTDGPLTADLRLLALPTFRPELQLDSGATITVSGPALFGLGTAAEDGLAQVAFDYGRAIVLPDEDAAEPMVLQLGDRRGRLEFGNEESIAAVEVQRYLPPGSDPREAEPLDAVLVYPLAGQVTWRGDAADPVEIEAGRVLAVVGDEPGREEELPELPGWIDDTDLTPIALHASRELGEYLTAAERPLHLALLGRTDYRRQEVRSLACRSLAALQIYEPILEALNDDRQRAFWAAEFDTLRSSVSLGRESAAALRAAAENLYEGDAETVYRLAWGYSPDQLESGAAAELVGHLEHERMIVRVLALWNLERITGMTHTFSAWKTPGQERTKITRWQQSLEEGRIAYRNPPSPFAELHAAEGAGESASGGP